MIRTHVLGTGKAPRRQKLAARDVPGLADVLDQDALTWRLVLGSVPLGCLGGAVAQRFVQDAAVESSARVELQEVGERGRDVDVAHGRRIAPAGTKIGAMGDQR